MNIDIRKDMEDFINFAHKVEYHSSLYNDLCINSLKMIDLVMLLEKKYNISIPDVKIPQLGTVKQLQDFVQHEYEKNTTE
jgi:acyl carrier protein